MRGAGLLLLAGVFASASPAWAQSYRLRGETLGRSRSESGILRLDGRSRLRPWMRVEAQLWAELGDVNRADALTLLFELRHPEGLGEVRAGRQLVGFGALRPTQVDGVHATARLPGGLRLDLVGGVPVARELDVDAGDWLAGARVGQQVIEGLDLGASFLLRYDRDDMSDQEVGADLRWLLWEGTTLSFRGAYDLIGFGFSELVGRGSWRGRKLRAELYATHRRPDLILPSSSIFTVLGADATQLYGGTLSWFAAPRLDVHLRAGLRNSGALGEDLSLRARLRLDPEGEGHIGAELRRQAPRNRAWSGARVLGRWPLAAGWSAATELELAIPDAARDRGALWPWGLVALAWAPAPAWQVSAAVEAGASPAERHQVNALLQAAYGVSAP